MIAGTTHENLELTEDKIIVEDENKIVEKSDININKIFLLVSVVGGVFYFGNKLIQKWKTHQNLTETTKPVDKRLDPFYME